MAGKYNPRSNSRMTLFLFLLAFSLLLILFSLSPLRTPSPKHFHVHNAETSFVAALDQFLAHTGTSPSLPDDTAHDDQIAKLDDAVYHSEMDRLYSDPYSPLSLPLRVYVYDMPPKFTYDLLWLFKNTYRDTSNLTSNGSPVHRLIEQHSIDYWLWADLIAPQSERLLTSVVRVHRQEEADLFYIPFFTTISFFLMEKQQCKALYRVKL